ncbi:hypothetical protein Mgra_00007197 [Meloidogyne graminicola]|uniref:Neur_chan_memb domain-containing protein n=1 Tax=Meloidogyne graminicola TaxID=189291 RepID=A0A8S9ZJN3_9BILA|nr:hypothetical protein Mgra_00007197 [Meloidogyne graminicola]
MQFSILFLPFSILFNFFFISSSSAFLNDSSPSSKRRIPSLQFLESLLSLKNLQSISPHSDISINLSNNSFNSNKNQNVQIYRNNTTTNNYFSLPLLEEEKELELINANLQRTIMIRQKASRTEENLYRMLLNPQNYEKNIRPTLHHYLPTNITFGVLLNQIVQMDEKNQILTTRCWINHMIIEVLYYQQIIFSTLKFASWGSHDSREIDIGLTTDQGDLSNYLNSTEFDLLSFRAERTLFRFSTDKLSTWPMIIATIRMRRRPLFYVFNHILPCVLISSMALLGFCMPPETGEKINMLNTVILSMGVYLQSIIESIPPTSETVPLIGIYYVASLAIVCLATAMNVYTLNVHRRGITNQRRVPWWMRKYILGYLATLLCIKVHEPDSVTLIKATRTRRSTIRRISLLRDLKHIKNIENCKETSGDERTTCECIKNSDEEKLPFPSNLMNRVDLKKNFQKRRRNFLQSSEDGCSPKIGRQIIGENGVGGEVEKLLIEQLKPRLTSIHPIMSAEFEERFRRILKRIYRSLQQFEIRDEVIDERKRIIWQWRTFASIIDLTIFIVCPILFRERLLTQNSFI